ncbi:MAG: oligosaccharide flippase family protein [Erysipelotrichaceae bacterium]|nr:oligosaccharide flippase family protein [Erysipelotrichaceae bacterium]
MKNNIRVNVIVNIIRTIVLTFLSFITFPWVCRYLGDASLGLYTWVNTFVAYFLILAKIGIPNLAVRECVKVRDDKERLSNKVQVFFLLQLIATILSFGFMCTLVFSIPALRDSQALVFILALNFLAGVFSFEWVFIALEKQFYMAVRSIVALTIAAILIVAFVRTPDDYLIYALITISVTVMTTIANVYYVRRYISFKKTLPYHFKEYLKPLGILFTLTLLISLYNQTDTFILGFIDPTKTEVASYSVGMKGIDIVIGVMTALSTVFIPRSAFYYQKDDKRFFNNLTKYSMNICMFVVFPAIVTMCILAFPICGLISGTYDYSDLSNGYLNAPLVLIILASIMLTYSFGNIIYGQILLPMKKEKYYLIAMASGTAINIVLSIVLGKYVFSDNPAIGVAIGTSVTDLAIIIYLCIMSWKWIKKAIFNFNTIKLLIASVAIIIASFALKYLIEYIGSQYALATSMIFIIELLGIVFVDALIYIGLLRVMKEDLVYSFAKHRRSEVIEK